MTVPGRVSVYDPVPLLPPDANGDRFFDLSQLAPRGTACARCGDVPQQVSTASWPCKPGLQLCDTHGWVCSGCLLLEDHGRVSCFVD